MNPASLQDAQAPAPGPTIRVASGTVLLDVVVTDRKNRVVMDLKREDFAVYEDGVPQSIEVFEPMDASGAASAAAGPRVPSHLIFLLDFTTTEFENQRRVCEAAARFVERTLTPGDYVAVFYLGTEFGLLQEFTNDRTKIAAVLTQRDSRGISTSQAGAKAAESAAQSPPSAETSVVAASLAAANSSLGVLGATSGLSSTLGEAGSARVDAGLGRMASAVHQRTTRDILTVLEGISRAVEPLEGRKALVLFSQGFVVGPHQEPELQRAVGVANRANVAVYAVDSGMLGASGGREDLASISAAGGRSRINATGGESIFDQARTAGGDAHESSLRYISAATGGIAFRNTNDVSGPLERVVLDMRRYFILGYRPANQNPDGRFRQIRVELKKPGLTARTRSGYVADPPRGEPLSAGERELMEGARSGSAPGLAFDVALAQFQAGTRQFRVPVTIEIPVRELRFGESGEKRAASLLIVGLLRDEQGNIVTRVGTPVTVSATPDEFRVLEKGSVSFTNTILLPPGRYSFEAFVRDQASGRGSIRDYGLQIPPVESRLAASSMVLSSEVEPLRDGERGGDLALGQVKVLPSARRQFRNGDNLVYLFNLYNVLGGEGQPAPSVEVRVAIERPGGAGLKLPAYRLTELEKDPVPHVTAGRYVALSGLTPGRYFIAAEAEDLNSKQVCRLRASFEIVQ